MPSVRQSKEKLLNIHKRNLRLLLEQLAHFGRANAPVHLLAQIEEETEQITSLCDELELSWPSEIRQSSEMTGQKADSTNGHKREENAVETLCDVCVFTSVPDEFKALRRVFERYGAIHFHQEYTRHGREIFVGQMENSANESLTLQLSCLPEMGGTNATIHILPILHEFHPRFVGMTGICAGDRAKVALGDLVVAIRAYEYETGKVIVRGGTPQLRHDVKTFSPHENLIGYVNLFEDWKEDVGKLKRPPSKRQQTDSLFLVLRSGRKLRELDVQSLDANAPQWRLISDEMTQAGLLDEVGALTAKAQAQISPPWSPHKDRAEAKLFAMVMGSGRAVRSDNPFPLLRDPERKLIAVDMEGANVYQVVETVENLAKRALVVKGVSDYGDEDKDDSYHDYASEASAIYMFHFIQRYVNQRIMPRLGRVAQYP